MRAVVRQVVNGVSTGIAAWHLLRYAVLARLGVATFQQASEAIANVPLFYGYRVRQAFYGRLLARCGDDLEMNVGATIAERASRIGDRVWVGPGSYLDLVDIGDDVLIGPRALVLAGGRHHRIDRVDVPIRQQGNRPLTVTRIGDGAWIGAGAVVMADVGEGAVVGAGAVVTNAVEPMAIVAGNPARPIGTRGAGAVGAVR